MACWSSVLVMLCKSPYSHKTGDIFPCGQCLPCRLNKRRVWAHRMMLEADCHPHNSFVTLTYAPEHLPSSGSLEPDVVKKWFKNLRDDYRKKTGDILRFYLVGEYGDKSWRPHYHLIIFNYPSCKNEYRKKWLRKRKLPCDCDSCSYIQARWSKGFTDVSTVTLHSVQYVAGYVTKKLTNGKNEYVAKTLDGRYPEFARMSLKPGIGGLAVDYIADALFDSETGELHLTENGDIPHLLTYAGKSLPIGRYLRGKLQEKLGISDETRQKNYKAWQKELRDVYYDSQDYAQGVSLKEFLRTKNAPKIARMERIHNKSQLKRTI